MFILGRRQQKRQNSSVFYNNIAALRKIKFTIYQDRVIPEVDRYSLCLSELGLPFQVLP